MDLGTRSGNDLRLPRPYGDGIETFQSVSNFLASFLFWSEDIFAIFIFAKRFLPNFVHEVS
jgi:hypothetical protein